MKLTAEQISKVTAIFESGSNLKAFAAANEIAPLDEWEGTDAMLLAAHLSFQLGSERQSDKLVRRAWGRDRGHAEATFYRAADLMNLRGPVHAIAFVRRVAASFKGDARTTAWWHALQAQIYATLRDFYTAEKHIAKAYAADSEDASIRTAKAHVFEMQDRYDDALAAAREGYSMNPRRRSVIAYLVHLLQIKENYDEAMDLLAKATNELESGWVVLQLADLQSELGDHAAAYESLRKIPALTPLRDERFQKMLDAKMADAAYMVGDISACIEFSESCGEPFRKNVAERLKTLKGDERRRVLKTGFLRQHNVTCAPATIANIARFWGREERHLDIAEAICYDGTPAYKERDWAAGNGWTVSEFTLNWDDLTALIDREVPFTLATTFPGMGHLQAVVGYDQKRRTALIRDPFVPQLVEFDVDALIESQSSTGPRSMAMVPVERAELLDGIRLEESEVYDLAHQVSTAIDRHDRQAAATAIDELRDRFPDHRLTLASQWELARYDSNTPRLFETVRRFLEKFPDDVNLKLAYVSIGRDFKHLEERRSELEAFAKDEKSDPSIWLQFGEELSADARLHDQALRWLWRTVRAMPTNGAALRAVANLLWARRDFDRACDLYRLAACANDRDEGLSYVYFLAARHLGRQDEALGFLRDRFERFGHLSAFPARTLFHALREISRTVEAFEVLDDAARKRPDDGELDLFLAGAKTRFGRIDEAEKHLEKASGKVPEAEWLREAAQVKMIAGDLGSARELLQRIIELNPTDQDVHSSIAFTISAFEGESAARDHIGEYIGKYPFNRSLKILMLGYLKDDPTAKLQILRDLVALNPNDFEAQRLLGDCLLKTGDRDGALEAVRLALAIDPNDSDSHVSLGRVLAKGGDNEDAAVSFEQAFRLAIDNPDALGERLELCKSADEKRTVLSDFFAEMCRQSSIGVGLEKYLESAKRVTDRFALLDRLREYRERNPDSWFACSGVVQLLTDLRRFDEALELANENTERFPLNSNVWYDLSLIQRLRGEPDAEIAALGEAVAVAPMWSWAVQSLADTYVRTGRPEMAESLVVDALSRLPLDNFLHGNLASIRWKMGMRDEAIESAKRALGIDPTYEWAWQVILSWGEEVGSPELAAELARDLTRRKPKDVNAWIQLAKVLGGNSWSQEAMSAVESALAIEPGNERALAIKASLLANARRFEDALKVCQFRKQDGRRPENLRLAEAGIEFDRGNADRASQILESLGRDAPDYYPAFIRLAEIYSTDSNRFYDYLRVTKEMTRLAPQDATTFGYYGEALLFADRRKEARSALSQALILSPDYTFAGVTLFFTALEDGDAEEALKALTTLETFNPDFQCRRMRVALAVHLKDIDALRPAWGELCRDKEATLPVLRESFDRILAAGLADDDELKSITRAAALDPEASPDVAGLLVAAMVARGQRSEAERELDGFRSEPRIWGSAAAAFIEELWKQSTETAHQYVRRHETALFDPNESWTAVGVFLQNVIGLRDASKWYEGWEKRESLGSFVYWNIFLVEMGLGLRERAFEVCRRGVEATADLTTDLHRVVLGVEAIQKGDAETARMHLAQVNPAQLNDWMSTVFRVATGTVEIVDGNGTGDPAEYVSGLVGLVLKRRELRREAIVRALVDPMFERAADRCGVAQRLWIKTRLFISRNL